MTLTLNFGSTITDRDKRSMCVFVRQEASDPWTRIGPDAMTFSGASASVALPSGFQAGLQCYATCGRISSPVITTSAPLIISMDQFYIHIDQETVRPVFADITLSPTDTSAFAMDTPYAVELYGNGVDKIDATLTIIAIDPESHYMAATITDEQTLIVIATYSTCYLQFTGDPVTARTNGLTEIEMG